MSERVVRFGVFEFTFATGQLRRDGRVLRLQAQPARLLAVLVADAGHVVSRDRLATLSVIGNAAPLRSPFARQDVQGVARQLGAEWVVIGQLKGDDRGLRVIGHLIRASDMKHLWASTYDHATFTLDAQAQVAEAIAAAVSHAVSSY